jgi:glycosyltransferase involved in cell wall biosynthesis
MKIGFDISQTGKQKAGCGYFADSLIRHLAEFDRENQYLLYPTFGDSYWDPDWASGACRISQPNFHPGLGHRTHEAARLFWNHPPEDFEAKLGSPDIIHSNNFYCPRGLRNARLVYTLYDLSFLAYPEWTTEENRAACFQGVFNASLYADFIISISHYSRKHFLEVFPHYPPDRIVVIHPASRYQNRSPAPRPEKIQSLSENGFWLTVGMLEPRKNHHRLLKAYALLQKDVGKTFPLVLAGGQGWLMDDFEKNLDDLGLRQDVIILGYVDDETLAWLYQNCFAFIYPSLFEGFGLPAMEAMSLGAPVIASDVSSLPEILEQAGILIDPLNEEALSQAMRRLFSQPEFRSLLRDKSRDQASRFSWTSAASATMECYREVLGRASRFQAGGV